MLTHFVIFVPVSCGSLVDCIHDETQFFVVHSNNVFATHHPTLSVTIPPSCAFAKFNIPFPPMKSSS